MSIAVLGQVYDEVRRLAIAGSAVAPGDFRLKKLIPPLEQAGAKAPVFAKIAEATSALVDSDEKSSSAALLDLGTLINAVLYTQGETGIEGELQEIESKSFGLSRTQTSARLLKPLLEALTSTGPGRMEIIRDAFERKLFCDLRLIRPALAALDDTYGEIADFVSEHILPIYGTAIAAELEAQFDGTGKAGHVRRLLLMHRLDPARARPHVLKALEEGSKEMRVAAISCLGSAPEDLAFLLEQAKAKAKDVRAVALRALSQCAADDATQVLCAAVEGKDLELAVDALRSSTQPKVLAALQQATDAAARNMLSSKEKDKEKVGKEMKRLLHLLQCLVGRTDPATEKIMLAMLEQREQWLAIKSQPSGADLLELLAKIMSSGSARMQRALADAHASLPVDCLKEAFLAACRVQAPDEVFAMFSPYLSAKSAKKRATDPAVRKQAAIIETILGRNRYWWPGADDRQETIVARLSPKWLDAAIDSQQDELIVRLAVPGNAKSNETLSRIVRDSMNTGKDVWRLVQAIETMIRVGHPQSVDVLIDVIQNASKLPAYYLAWIARLIPTLPRDTALPRFESLASTLPEKAASVIIEYVVELKTLTPVPAETT